MQTQYTVQKDVQYFEKRNVNRHEKECSIFKKKCKPNTQFKKTYSILKKETLIVTRWTILSLKMIPECGIFAATSSSAFGGGLDDHFFHFEGKRLAEFLQGWSWSFH